MNKLILALKNNKIQYTDFLDEYYQDVWNYCDKGFFNFRKNFNEKYNESFNYIKAKFVGYSDNEEVLKELNEPFKTYAESIKISRNGNLKMSLQNLNELIKKNNNNFLLETNQLFWGRGYL